MRIKKTQFSLILLFLLLAQIGLVPYSLALSNTFQNEKISIQDEMDKENITKLIDFEGEQKLKDFTKSMDNNFNDEVNIFDIALTEDLNNIQQVGGIEDEFMKVVVLFNKETKKSQRNKVLSRYIPSFKIIDNYNIIPGMYISVNSKYLTDSQEFLANSIEIKKIYKSQTYEYSLFESSSVLNTLNEEDFSNWWIEAVGAENLQYDGTGVKVAVIDSGIYDHPDLYIINRSNFVSGDNATEDLNGHGTHVAGIIASNGDGSGAKYKGIAPGVWLVDARGGGSSGGLEGGDVISAIEWCTYEAKVDIISMSFGGGLPEAEDPITLAASSAVEEGVMCVASAGNSGPEYFTASSPAAGVDVIAVGATDVANELASFSSRGPIFSYIGYPDIVAPGVNIIATAAKDAVITKEKQYLGDYFDFEGTADYIPLSGTSMSCPVVSGALAIIKQAYPNITPETGRIALIEGAVSLTDSTDAEILNSGAGLINIPNSLEFLSNQNQEVNDVAIFFPNHLPVSPYDFIRFPGDKQKFQLMVISGKANTYSIQTPAVNGISINVDESTLTFNDPGIKLISLELEISHEIALGTKQFQIELVKGGVTYDVIDISLNIKLPTYRVLMESFHGLNDWLVPELSYNQLGFYDAMSDLTYNYDISVDYTMEYWNPDYNKYWDSSILSEEKVAQYDLIVLQNPILPFNDIEISALKNYYDNGGNILFLGTRYQDLCVKNLNDVFDELNIDIEIEDETVMDMEWAGVGMNVTSHSVNNLNDTIIFNNVEELYWMAGNSFSTTGLAKSIAYYNEKTVAALYDGSTQGKGKFIAFGDLSWLYSQYTSEEYQENHQNLLSNLVDYFFNEVEISLNLQLGTYRTSSESLELFVYATDEQGNYIPSESLNNDLTASISNTNYANSLTMSSSIDGIAASNSFPLPSYSTNPYKIDVSLTIGANIYTKSTKMLYFPINKIPQINSIGITEYATRDRELIEVIANLDSNNYDVNGYLTFYSYSFYNQGDTNSKQLAFSYANNNYSANYLLTPTDTSGFGIAYIVPEETSEGYFNPYSPRIYSFILNYNPEIDVDDSTFSFGNSDEIEFEDTIDDDSIRVFSATQSSTFNFRVKAEEVVNFEDDDEDLKVSVNLFIATISEDGFISILFPDNFPNTELMYDDNSNLHLGSFIIPDTMNFNTIKGIKSISTATADSNDYIGLFLVSVTDTEGGFSTEPFIIVITISQIISPIPTLIVAFVVLGILGVPIIFIVIRLIKKKQKTRNTTSFNYRAPSETSVNVETTEKAEDNLKEGYYCPYCGHLINTPKKFCPNCGKSLDFVRKL